MVNDLESLIDPVTRREPESALRWTCEGTSKLAEALKELGHEVGKTSVRALLGELGYSPQANAKVHEGTNHPDRNAQFEYINASTHQRINASTHQRARRGILAANEPVISVDTKRKEQIGDFKRRARVAPEGTAGTRPGSRLYRSRTRQGDPIRRQDIGRDEGWSASASSTIPRNSA